MVSASGGYVTLASPGPASHDDDMDLITPTPADRPLFDRLAQLYAYDFSPMTDLRIDAEGRFGAHPCFAAIWTDPNRHARLIRTGGEIAGFAIVLETPGPAFEIEQFFVMRKFRKRGLGRAAAVGMLDQFRGRWTVDQVHENPAAQVFWRRVVSTYTRGEFATTCNDGDVTLHFANGPGAP